jgi:hypothetical protein
MTMGWMETIRFLGLDLMVATVFAVASLDAAAFVLKSAWGRIPGAAASRGSVRPAGNGLNLSAVPYRPYPSARRSYP